MRVVLLLLPLLLSLGCSHIKSAGHTVGHATKTAAHAVGEGAKEVTTKIGHTSRDAVHAVKEKVSE